ncbi:MAG: efflux RND transporter periplasmic adaptor subunit [Bacteroidota bacterium]
MKTCILYLLLGGLWISACNTQPETQAAIQETDSTRATSTQAHEAHADNHVELSAAQAKSINLQLGNMEQKNLSEVVKVSGKLDVPPQNLVTIHAPVSGFVKSTDLLQGMPVKKGQVIAILQNQDYVQIQQDYVESKSRVEFPGKRQFRQSFSANPIRLQNCPGENHFSGRANETNRFRS